MYQIKSPVLLVIFNRLETTKEVFEKIREGKPGTLFVAADGPRPHKEGELDLCQRTRELINVDWPCDFHTLYREENIGCAASVSGAIDWFFKHVPHGVILEDDCLPEEGFFRFCDEMLEYYADNEQIFEVAGTNLQGRNRRGSHSYYFSRYGGIWGWGTWARAWNKYDGEMHGLAELETSRKLKSILKSETQEQYWIKIFNTAIGPSVWDYRWIYSMWKNDGICIVPNTNLVKNIGFGHGATHTSKAPAWYAKLTSSRREIFPISHPTSIRIDSEADDFQFEQSMNLKPSWTKTVIKKVLKL